VARNTDDRQVWAPPEDPDAQAWDVYGYAHGTAPLQDAGPALAGRPRRDTGRALRLVALTATVIGLAGLTFAACVLSYSSMHHLATQAGVSARLASVYPLIFDALLVVTGCSVLALRGAGLVSRMYGWLCMLVLLGCLAAGGAVHAAAVRVPRHLAGVVAAIVPWALVLIGFGLLLTLLRYARVRRTQVPRHRADPDDRESTAPGTQENFYETGNVTESAGGGYAEPAISAATPAGAGYTAPAIPAAPESERGASPDAPPDQAADLNPAPTPDDETGQVPPFRRTRSLPTPPGE
jgi:uncharacterized protein DUF2637